VNGEFGKIKKEQWRSILTLFSGTTAVHTALVLWSLKACVKNHAITSLCMLHRQIIPVNYVLTVFVKLSYYGIKKIAVFSLYLLVRH
jgi:hypothetical protein